MSYSKVMLHDGIEPRPECDALPGGAVYIWSSRHDGSPPPAGQEAVISSHGAEVPAPGAQWRVFPRRLLRQPFDRHQFVVPDRTQLVFYADDGAGLNSTIGGRETDNEAEAPNTLIPIASKQAVPRETIPAGGLSKNYYLQKYQRDAWVESYHFLRYAMHWDYRRDAAALTRAHCLSSGTRDSGLRDEALNPVCRQATMLPPRPKGLFCRPAQPPVVKVHYKYAYDLEHREPITMDVITIAAPSEVPRPRAPQETPLCYEPRPTLESVLQLLLRKNYNYQRIHGCFCRVRHPLLRRTSPEATPIQFK